MSAAFSSRRMSLKAVENLLGDLGVQMTLSSSEVRSGPQKLSPLAAACFLRVMGMAGKYLWRKNCCGLSVRKEKSFYWGSSSFALAGIVAMLAKVIIAKRCLPFIGLRF